MFTITSSSICFLSSSHVRFGWCYISKTSLETTSDTGGLCGQADAQPRDDAAYSSDIGGQLANPRRVAK